MLGEINIYKLIDDKIINFETIDEIGAPHGLAISKNNKLAICSYIDNAIYILKYWL